MQRLGLWGLERGEQINQSRDQRFVGGGHGIVTQSLRSDPLQGLVFAGGDKAFPTAAHIKRH